MTLHISHSTEKIDHFENKYYREVRRGMQPSSKIGGGGQKFFIFQTMQILLHFNIAYQTLSAA